jgi:hypothetical protein
MVSKHCAGLETGDAFFFDYISIALVALDGDHQEADISLFPPRPPHTPQLGAGATDQFKKSKRRKVSDFSLSQDRAASPIDRGNRAHNAPVNARS